MNEIEELDLDLGELQQVFNGKWQRYPMVSFAADGKTGFVNRSAERIINFTAFTISYNDKYVVFTPFDGKQGCLYRLTTRRGNGTSAFGTASLTAKIPSIRGKHYKLYKSGDRLCFKWREPMEGV